MKKNYEIFDKKPIQSKIILLINLFLSAIKVPKNF